MPPHDMDAEASVLSAVILDPSQLDVVQGILQPEHFYSDANKRICEAIYAVAEEGIAVDITTVVGWLRDRQRLEQVGGSPYIGQIVDATPAVHHVTDHALRVRDKAKARYLIATCQTWAAYGYGDYGDISELVEGAESAIAEVANDGRRQELEQVGEIMRSHVERLRADRERGIQVLGLSTGFQRLDEQTGGLFGGDLYIIAGRPGMGKTAFAGTLASNVTKIAPGEEAGAGVAFFSLEMPGPQMATRFACSTYLIEFQSVRTNRMTDAQFSDLTAAAEALLDLPVWIDDTPALTLGELRARSIKLKRDIETGRAGVACKRLGVIVVDYLQLMSGKRERGDSREQEVSGLSRGLKKLAKDLDVAVIALSQLNRAVEKTGRKEKRPQLSDLRESGAIEQDADSVWFVHRKSYYDKEASRGEADIDVAKQRNGPTGRVKVGFRGAFMSFYNYEGNDDFDDFCEFDELPDNV